MKPLKQHSALLNNFQKCIFFKLQNFVESDFIWKLSLRAFQKALIYRRGFSRTNAALFAGCPNALTQFRPAHFRTFAMTHVTSTACRSLTTILSGPRMTASFPITRSVTNSDTNLVAVWIYAFSNLIKLEFYSGINTKQLHQSIYKWNKKSICFCHTTTM